MHEINFDNVKKYLNTKLIFNYISFQINDGDRVGIVGKNGCGKTTILKLIAGILKLNHCAGYPYAPIPPGYDEGWVNVTKNTTCSYLEQIPQFCEEMKVIDVLNLSFKEIYEIEKKMRKLEEDLGVLDGNKLEQALLKYSDLIQIYESKGGYQIEEKLNRVCVGLKLDNEFLKQNFNSLSGGEKTRVMLGKLLIDSPNVLLLDEPTNNLDMDSIEWLEDYINNYKGIVVVVSHDRYFLDHIATKIIEVEDKKCMTFHGNFSEYTKQKEEYLKSQRNIYKEQNKKITNMKQSISELKNWGMKSENNKFFKRAQSIQTKLNKMKKIKNPINKNHMNVKFNTNERAGKIVINAKDLTKKYGEKFIFEDANLLIEYGERVALVGPNGCGKSTFIKMLLGEVPMESGEVALGANVKLGYLPQDILIPNEELTILEYFREDLSVTEGKAREYLAKFMIYGGNVFKKIKLLSGGERVRLMLSKLIFNHVNLLILDEPTNHLDIESIKSIEEAIVHFKGTILFISHDRFFINKICERVIAIENHQFVNYLGNYDYYKQKLLKEMK